MPSIRPHGQNTDQINPKSDLRKIGRRSRCIHACMAAQPLIGSQHSSRRPRMQGPMSSHWADGQAQDARHLCVINEQVTLHHHHDSVSLAASSSTLLPFRGSVSGQSSQQRGLSEAEDSKVRRMGFPNPFCASLLFALPRKFLPHYQSDKSSRIARMHAVKISLLLGCN